VRVGVTALLVVLACLAPAATAKGGNGSHASSSSAHSSTAPYRSSAHSNSGAHSRSSHPGSGSHGKAAPWVHRDAHGKIARDPRQTNAFKKAHPCPSTGKASGSCPGYVIDHVVPLKRGGADTPGNMQWQTEGAAKAKDKWE
jgi:hypothetical protein